MSAASAGSGPERRRSAAEGGRENPSSGAGSEGPLRRGSPHWAGEPVQVWEQRWRVPLFEAHDRLGSSNDRLRELARSGTPPFTVIVAEEQTAGRGRAGRRWHSPPGRGLWMSVLLPQERRGRPPLTPLLVGLAVTRAVREIAPEVETGIKWPNDVVVEGRKLCGILCEGEPGIGTVAGMGVNVHGDRASLPTDLRERATTLEQEAGREVRRPELAGALIRSLRTLLDPIPDRIEGSLAEELAELDVLRGRPVKTDGGLRGRGAGIAPDGALLMESPDGGVERVVAGGVEHHTRRGR